MYIRLWRWFALTRIHLLSAWYPHGNSGTRSSRPLNIKNNGNYRQFWPFLDPENGHLGVRMGSILIFNRTLSTFIWSAKNVTELLFGSIETLLVSSISFCCTLELLFQTLKNLIFVIFIYTHLPNWRNRQFILSVRKICCIFESWSLYGYIKCRHSGCRIVHS